MMSTKNYKIHENGRPTRYSQTQIRKELRAYYERGISATATSTNLGINVKTVCKYFNKWSEEEQEREREEVLQRRKRERERSILAYDQLQMDTHRFIDNIDKLTETAISQNGTIPRHLLTSRLDSMKFVAYLIERKSNLKLSKDNIRDKEEELTAILANEISEDSIRKIVTYLIFDGEEKDAKYTQRNLLYEIIKLEKCDETQANLVFEKMAQMGLKGCLAGFDSEDSFAEIYGIVQFGIMRGFVTKSEISRYMKSKKSRNGLMNDLVTEA